MVITEENGRFTHACDCGWSKSFRQVTNIVCPQCRGTAPPRPPKEPRVDHPPQQLGDKVQEFLQSYEITEDWWKGFKEQFGLPPNCGCKRRKDWLNATAEAHPTIANIGVKLLDALKRKA